MPLFRVIQCQETRTMINSMICLLSFILCGCSESNLVFACATRRLEGTNGLKSSVSQRIKLAILGALADCLTWISAATLHVGPLWMAFFATQLQGQ